MNFYDKIHELVRGFKETNEYTEYMELKSKIKADVSTYALLKTFKEEQKENQVEYISTGKVSEEKQKKLENDYSILIQKEDVRKLFENEMKLDIMLADMQKILGEAVKEIVDF